MGDEDPRVLLKHFISVANSTLGLHIKDFGAGFMACDAIDELYKKVYLEIHQRYIQAQPSMANMDD
jgi:hypothetical protein